MSPVPPLLLIITDDGWTPAPITQGWLISLLPLPHSVARTFPWWGTTQEFSRTFLCQVHNRREQPLTPLLGRKWGSQLPFWICAKGFPVSLCLLSEGLMFLERQGHVGGARASMPTWLWVHFAPAGWVTYGMLSKSLLVNRDSRTCAPGHCCPGSAQSNVPSRWRSWLSRTFCILSRLFYGSTLFLTLSEPESFQGTNRATKRP